MADSKAKPKGDAATIQQMKARQEELEQMVREECRNYDKEKKYRKKLEQELEDERNEKMQKIAEASQAAESLEAERKEKEMLKQEITNTIARLEAEKKESERLKLEADERLQHERREKEKAQEELNATGGLVSQERDQLLQQAREAEAWVERERVEKERAWQIAAAREQEKQFYQETYAHLEAENREKTEQLSEEIKKLMEEKEKAERERKTLLDRLEEIGMTDHEKTKYKWGPHKDKPWTEEEVKRLRKVVLKSRKDTDRNPINLKILVFGPTGNGKSSLCNGIRSAIYGTEQPTTYYAVADGSESLTSGFHGAQYGDHWIIDMAGIFESKKIESSNIKDILSGKVPFYAEMTDNLEVRDESKVELPPPGKNDVSCVVLVMRYDMDLGPEVTRQIDTVKQLAGKGVVSFHLVLTRLDDCDPQFIDTARLPHLYESERVQAAVQRISQETGIAPLSISFVKNYVRETETDMYTFILHLRVLEKIIFSAVEQVEKRLDQKRQRNMYKVKNFSCTSCCFLFLLSSVVLVLSVVFGYYLRDIKLLKS